MPVLVGPAIEALILAAVASMLLLTVKGRLSRRRYEPGARPGWVLREGERVRPANTSNVHTTSTKTKPRRWPWIIGMVVSLFIGIGIGAAGAPSEPEETSAAAQVTDVSPTELVSPSPSPSPTPETVSQEFRLTQSDVHLSLKTTERQCFGSAGCSVTVQVRASLDDAILQALPEDGQWDVTYQITGDDSGPIIGRSASTETASTT